MTVLPNLIERLHQLDLPYADRFDDRLLVSIALALAQPASSSSPTRAILLRLESEYTWSKRDRQEAVQRIASEVAWICTVIFALTTHSVQCTPRLSAQAFLRALFVPDAAQAESSAAPRPAAVLPVVSPPSVHTGRFSMPLARRRSSVPLSIAVPDTSGRSDSREDLRTPTRAEYKRRPTRSNTATSSPLVESFSDPSTPAYTGPSVEDGDSSAGEDLYPTSASPTTTSFRAAAMSRRVGSADSGTAVGGNSSARPKAHDRRRSSVSGAAGGRRRFSANATDRPSREGLIGLGLGGTTAMATNPSGSNSVPTSRRPSLMPLRTRRRSTATSISTSLAAPTAATGPATAPLPVHPLQASYLQQAERRPSIASIQSAMTDATLEGRRPSATSPRGSRLSTEQFPRDVAEKDLSNDRNGRPTSLTSSPSISFSVPPISPSRSRKQSNATTITGQSATYPPLKPSRSPSARTAPTSPLANHDLSSPSSPTFSSSSDFAVPEPANRTLPQVLIIQHLEEAKPSVQDQLLAVLRDRRFTVRPNGLQAGAAGSAASPTRSASSMATPTRAGTGPRPRRMSTSNVRGPAAPSAASAFDVAEADRVPLPAPTTRAREAALESRFAKGVEAVEMSQMGARSETTILPETFLCVAIVCDGDEERTDSQEWSGVSRHLLDRFTLSYTIPTSLLSGKTAGTFSAPPLHPLSSPTASLILPLPLSTDALPDFISASLDTYVSDLISALRHHPRLDARMLTARAVQELRSLTRVWAALTKGVGALALRQSTHGAYLPLPPPSPKETVSSAKSATTSSRQEKDEEIVVLPSDVLAVLISVVGHRLAVREPKDEKSLFWGSTAEALEARRKAEPASVEDLIRQVVAVV
ncbi:hypothetical protein JCM10908_006796 [Rhodotorula pacifica]|uniref:uncharacterized protein n=1 Tax=Rhodotorula pacifica TaxID=1495444 RepID=UPI003179DCE4